MKLLLDENLSRKLVPFLQSAWPGSTQLALVGLEQASDRDIWQYAREHDYAIVTKDADYYDLSLVLGAPPCDLITGRQRGQESHSETAAR
jgi:predicted nuclease of predicted toxin-antitoxin system